jgi:hypothetical protein
MEAESATPAFALAKIFLPPVQKALSKSSLLELQKYPELSEPIR